MPAKKSSTHKKSASTKKASAKKTTAKRKYGKSVQEDVKNEMHRFKKGTAKSGKDGKRKVTSKKQAIAIALSKARKKGKKVPKRKSTAKK